MGLLIANDNLLTALGITNKEQFDLTFADFSEFETFVEKCGYEYDFDEEGNLILITPKSKEINTGINGFKPDKNYFAITALEDTEVSIYLATSNVGGSKPTSFSYSSDGRNWITLTPNAQYNSWNINKGETIYCKGLAGGYGNNSFYNPIFTSTHKIDVSGNILSLFYDEDFEDKKLFPAVDLSLRRVLLQRFFKNCPIVNAKDLILSAEDLYEKTYFEMFSGCNELITGPQIMSKTIVSNSCNNMFENCTKLSLISYNIIDFTDINSNWVNNVSNLGTFKLLNQDNIILNNGVYYGKDGIPRGWTVLNSDNSVIQPKEKVNITNIQISKTLIPVSLQEQFPDVTFDTNPVINKNIVTIYYSNNNGSTWTTTKPILYSSEDAKQENYKIKVAIENNPTYANSVSESSFTITYIDLNLSNYTRLDTISDPINVTFKNVILDCSETINGGYIESGGNGYMLYSRTGNPLFNTSASNFNIKQGWDYYLILNTGIELPNNTGYYQFSFRNNFKITKVSDDCLKDKIYIKPIS